MSPRYYDYSAEVSNEYLGLSKTVKGDTEYEVEMKAREQLRIWSEREKRERLRQATSDLKARAERMTKEAEALVDQYRGILAHTLDHDDRVQWSALVDRRPYQSFRFREKEPTEKAVELRVPRKSWLEAVVPGLRGHRLRLEGEASMLRNQHQEEYLKRKLVYQIKRLAAYRKYLEDKAAYEADQTKRNEELESFRLGYEAREASCVEKYIRLVLEKSKYPDDFEKDYDVQYDPISQTAVVDYRLPSPRNVPSIVEHRYSTKDKAIKTVQMKAKDFAAFYEAVLYQIVLRTIHEVFGSDYQSAVNAVVFNGWVEGTDSATGRDVVSCLVSCQAGREEFLNINLAKVDARQCFRSLKGLSAGPLANLAPVRPILAINREDKRFVDPLNVLDDVESIPNLATMDWEDFEHLVRGLFEKVFSRENNEVKITRASRDYGVDAIAFDPDPIRGGKFVIQAKRYNNVVPVSAVRDLYGTMINEGAAKGILVTTSYYGADSRDFARDKPITLIDGSNLVFMLSEHGYKARIELQK